MGRQTTEDTEAERKAVSGSELFRVFCVFRGSFFENLRWAKVSPSLRRPPAIDHNVRAGDKPRALRTEKNRELPDHGIDEFG